MYKIGHRNKKLRHHIEVVLVILFITFGIISIIIWYFGIHTSKASLKQAGVSSELFDPSDVAHNIKIDTPLYNMELPHTWKEIARNKDPRYNNIEWQMINGASNRWLKLYTDHIPTDLPFNRIIPITIRDNKIVIGSISDNCIKFTPSDGKSLRVQSKWQDAGFLCDFDNQIDNVVGVSEKSTGTIFTLTGKQTGTHSYMFVYTDRGIPEDEIPIKTALSTLTPK